MRAVGPLGRRAVSHRAPARRGLVPPRPVPVRVSRWLATWLLPFVLMACGGQGCSGCSAQTAAKHTPEVLVLPGAAQFRLTQHGFDVIAADVVGLMKAVLGSNAQGQAAIDVGQLLGVQSLQIAGGLGLFQGKAAVRDLVLTLDLDALSVQLVDGSAPARLRIGIDHARLGVDQGVVSGEASFAGITSDAACHVLDGLDPGTPDARIATVSAEIDLVLGVDAKGGLQVQVKVAKPVLHDVGFALQKDCALAECQDKLLAEPACLECDVCQTGKLASDALATVKQLLEPVLSQVLEIAGNLVASELIAKSLNGKPLDVELAVDLRPTLQKASPLLGGLLGPGGPLYVRARPSPQAFAVVAQGLQGRFDAAVFAQAHACVAEPGPDATPVFAQVPQGPAPPIPQQMAQAGADGKPVPRPVDLALLVGRNTVEEGLWAALRSGLLCIGVDSTGLYHASGGKLLLQAGALDLVLPGVRELASAGAPLRLVARPSARPEDAPRVVLAAGAGGQTLLQAELSDFEVGVELLVRGRWLTVLEVRADVRAELRLEVVAGHLRLSIGQVAVPAVAVLEHALFPHADVETLAPAVAQVGVGLLFAQPLDLDLDVQAMIAQALALPVQAELLGVQAAGPGADWLVLGVALQAGKGAK